ncbi:SRPBCC family protein [Jiangella endophytica]|uniref:SRPBCC family protein n=1 Tax=Jiangella endophytica TaxID=1623398 RepID=UPI000E349367|nr:SRPBCC family protein [Jiangella endophytica]
MTAQPQGRVVDARRAKERRRTLMAAAALMASTTAAVAARARLRNWGATEDETLRRLPGDDFIFDADAATTRAVTVNAPREEVWRWLVQIGQDRGGWYSYDWLENLFGLDIHSAHTVRDEWQHLEAGDQVRAAPAGALGMQDGYVFRVARVEPGRVLVLRQRPPVHPWNATWAFVLVDDVPGSCRLLVRCRAKRTPGLSGRLAWIGGELMDPVVLVMTRRMLLGIRARSEFAHDQRRRRALT